MKRLLKDTGAGRSCFAGSVQVIQMAMAHLLLPNDVRIECRVVAMLHDPGNEILTLPRIWVLPLVATHYTAQWHERAAAEAWFCDLESLQVGESVMVNSKLNSGALRLSDRSSSPSSVVVELSSQASNSATKATWADFLLRLQHLWEERQTTNQGTETQTEKVQQILSPHELQTAQAAFKKIDKDKSGELSTTELCDALMHIHPNLRPSDAFKRVRRLFSEVDEDDNRQISFEEFLKIVNLVKIEDTTFDDFL